MIKSTKRSISRLLFGDNRLTLIFLLKDYSNEVLSFDMDQCVRRDSGVSSMEWFIKCFNLSNTFINCKITTFLEVLKRSPWGGGLKFPLF